MVREKYTQCDSFRLKLVKSFSCGRLLDRCVDGSKLVKMGSRNSLQQSSSTGPALQVEDEVADPGAVGLDPRHAEHPHAPYPRVVLVEVLLG